MRQKLPRLSEGIALGMLFQPLSECPSLRTIASLD
jgi:hypothetical protein